MKKEDFIRRLENIKYPTDKAKDLYDKYSNWGKLEELENYIYLKESINEVMG